MKKIVVWFVVSFCIVTLTTRIVAVKDDYKCSDKKYTEFVESLKKKQVANGKEKLIEEYFEWSPYSVDFSCFDNFFGQFNKEEGSRLADFLKQLDYY